MENMITNVQRLKVAATKIWGDTRKLNVVKKYGFKSKVYQKFILFSVIC